MRYLVEVPEVWYQKNIIDADSPEQAIEKVKNGEGELVDNGLEYSHTLDEGFHVEEE